VGQLLREQRVLIEQARGAELVSIATDDVHADEEDDEDDDST
jgi:hypothetical protein